MGMGEKEHEGGGSGGSGGRSKDHARHGLPPPNRDALNGMGEFVLAQVRRGASEQQWADWLKIPFEHACLASDMSTVRRLLEAGVNGPYDRPRDPRYRRHTLLHLAAACGNTEVVKVLLRWGSAPDVACREPGDKAYTPLHRAALGGHGEAARVLIKAGADKDARTGGSGASPLHLSARKGHEGCVRSLLLTGADRDAKRNLDGATPLHQAAFFGQMGAVRELLLAVANPNAQDAEGCTPVFLAAQEGHEEVVVELLENGASSDMSREDGWSPLHAASRFGHAATALALLNVGQANFEAATGDHGSTPLHVAAISGFDEVLTVLMDIGSDLESLDSGGWTPLHCACAAARASCVNALIGRGADPTAVTPEGQRPSSLIGTDLADGEEPNHETNETIWNMLRVPRAEFEARQRRHAAKHAGNRRPPPPYNDRPPPAYGPDSIGGLFDSQASGSGTGSVSGSFSGSGSRQHQRSPTEPRPREAPVKTARDGRRPLPRSNSMADANHQNYHHQNGHDGDRERSRGRRVANGQQRPEGGPGRGHRRVNRGSDGDVGMQQQQRQQQGYSSADGRRPRVGSRDEGRGKRRGGVRKEEDALGGDVRRQGTFGVEGPGGDGEVYVTRDEADADVDAQEEEEEEKREGGDVLGGLGGYNPVTDNPSAQDKRLSTGGMVEGYSARGARTNGGSNGSRSPPVPSGVGSVVTTPVDDATGRPVNGLSPSAGGIPPRDHSLSPPTGERGDTSAPSPQGAVVSDARMRKGGPRSRSQSRSRSPPQDHGNVSAGSRAYQDDRRRGRSPPPSTSIRDEAAAAVDRAVGEHQSKREVEGRGHDTGDNGADLVVSPPKSAAISGPSPRGRSRSPFGRSRSPFGRRTPTGESPPQDQPLPRLLRKGSSSQRVVRREGDRNESQRSLSGSPKEDESSRGREGIKERRKMMRGGVDGESGRSRSRSRGPDRGLSREASSRGVSRERGQPTGKVTPKAATNTITNSKSNDTDSMKAVERSSIGGDGRRSSAGRVSGGNKNVFNSGEGDIESVDIGADHDTSENVANGVETEKKMGTGVRGKKFGRQSGRGEGMTTGTGTGESMVAKRIAAFDPFAFSQKDAANAPHAPAQQAGGPAFRAKGRR